MLFLNHQKAIKEHRYRSCVLELKSRLEDTSSFLFPAPCNLKSRSGWSLWLDNAFPLHPLQTLAANTKAKSVLKSRFPVMSQSRRSFFTLMFSPSFNPFFTINVSPPPFYPFLSFLPLMFLLPLQCRLQGSSGLLVPSTLATAGNWKKLTVKMEILSKKIKWKFHVKVKLKTKV